MHAGVAVVHTVTLANNGSVALRGVAFTPQGTPPTNTSCQGLADGSTLPVGSSLACIITYTLTQDDIEAGTIIRAAQVVALPAAGATSNFTYAVQLAAVAAVSSPSMAVSIDTQQCNSPELAGGCGRCDIWPDISIMAPYHCNMITSILVSAVFLRNRHISGMVQWWYARNLWS